MKMWLKSLNLFLVLIFLTGCFQTEEDLSTQEAYFISGKSEYILNAKQKIEMNERTGDEVVEEPEKPENPEDPEDPTTEEPEEPEDPVDEEPNDLITEDPETPDNKEPSDNYTDQQKADENFTGVESETGLYIVSNPDSLHVYVNKNRRLPEGYAPKNLVEPNVSQLKPEGDVRRLLVKVAADALEDLFSAANEEGIALAAVSGYRTNQLQSTIFQGHVSNRGLDHAIRFSARPGTSEHETGLAMDVSAASVAFALSQSFSETSEGTWLAENAAEFGFTIRYPKGKESITGYAYEPWHLRYVGKELADHLYETSLTLEEYFGYHY